jgi:hypothetical protein
MKSLLQCIEIELIFDEFSIYFNFATKLKGFPLYSKHNLAINSYLQQEAEETSRFGSS